MRPAGYIGYQFHRLTLCINRNYGLFGAVTYLTSRLAAGLMAS